MSATVDLGSFGTMTSAPHAVSLVSFSSLQLRLDASPAGPTGITTLRKVRARVSARGRDRLRVGVGVRLPNPNPNPDPNCNPSPKPDPNPHQVQCTDTYQRAKPHVTATLSTGEARDVTAHCGYSGGAPPVVPSVVSVENGALFSGAAAGTATVTATFGGADAGAKGSASAALLVDEGTVEVQSMALSTPAVLHAASGSVFGSTLAVTLTDGTHYADIHALSWLDATAVVGHATDTP